MQHQPDDNLDALGGAAQAGLEQRRSRIAAKAENGSRLPQLKRWASWAILIAAITFVLSEASTIRAVLFGLPTKTKLADAEIVLEAARQAVEAHRKITREIPNRVPLAALDALVRLELTADGSYRLVLEANGVTAQMDAAGVMTATSK
jgi:hypothetical protein